MKIPKKFKLAGQTITVELRDDLIQEENMQGEAHYRFNRIRLQKDNKGEKRIIEQIEESFCHELVHWILKVMEEEKLNDDEKFISVFARFLHQALNSFEDD